MIVTTSRRNANELQERALFFSEKLETAFVSRDDRSIQRMIAAYDEDLFVVSKEKLALYSKQGGDPFFYHPNSAMPRGKFFLHTGYDPLVEAAQLREGMTFLDCTLGLGADSLIAKLAVGRKGKVIGLEANAGIAMIVKHGLQTWVEGDERIVCAMKGIEVVRSAHLDYLKALPDRSIDVVYFDPMFEQQISASLGIEALKLFAHHEDLSLETIEEARRVATSRIVLKDHWQSKRFKRHQFHVIVRKNTVFHYGFIQI